MDIWHMMLGCNANIASNILSNSITNKNKNIDIVWEYKEKVALSENFSEEWKNSG